MGHVRGGEEPGRYRGKTHLSSYGALLTDPHSCTDTDTETLRFRYNGGTSHPFLLVNERVNDPTSLSFEREREHME